MENCLFSFVILNSAFCVLYVMALATAGGFGKSKYVPGPIKLIKMLYNGEIEVPH